MRPFSGLARPRIPPFGVPAPTPAQPRFGLLNPPDSGGAVASAGAKQGAVVIEGNGVDARVVPEVGCQELAGFGFPDLYSAVRAASGELFAVR